MLVQSRILYQALQYHFLLLALITNFLPIDTESTIVNQYIVSTYFMPLLLCMNSRCSLLKSTSPHRPNVRARKNERSEDPSSLPRLLRCWRFSKHSWRCVQLDFQVFGAKWNKWGLKVLLTELHNSGTIELSQLGKRVWIRWALAMYLSDQVHKLLHSLWMKEDEMCLVKSLGCFIRQLKDWPSPSF